MQLINLISNRGAFELPDPFPADVLHHSHWKQLVSAIALVDARKLSNDESDLFNQAFNLAEDMPLLQQWVSIDKDQPETVQRLIALKKIHRLRTYVKNYAVVKDGTTIPAILKRLADIHRRQTAAPDPKVAAILAMTEYGGIGKNNDLPWGRIKGDLARFKMLTLGNVVIQGFNTYMSIGKPLPGRINIVVTSRSAPTGSVAWPEGVHVVDSVEAALTLAKSFETPWIYVIGGAQLYDSMMPHCSKIELTVVAGEHACDTFVKFDRGTTEWHFDKLESVNHDNGTLSHVYYQLLRR